MAVKQTKIDGVALKKQLVGHCISCMRDYPLNRFYKSKANNLGNLGIIPYCSDCCEEIFKYYLKEKESVESALFYTCAKLDMPFIREVYEKVLTYKDEVSEDKDIDKINVFKCYYNFLWGTKSIQKESDLWSEFADSNVSLDEVQTAKKSEEVFKQDYEKFTLVWGEQSVEDFQFLEYRYDVYTNGKALTPAEETLYRNLCLLELRKRKKESNKDGDGLGESTKEEVEQIIKTMDKLKISNFDDNKDKSDTERLIERQIWEHENEDPCEIVDLETYKDLCGIEKTWKQLLRAVKNLVAGTKEYPDINSDPDEW